MTSAAAWNILKLICFKVEISSRKPNNFIQQQTNGFTLICQNIDH